jgi:hypothetical protein
MSAPRRRDYRAAIPPAQVLGLALWSADTLGPGDIADPAALGAPQLDRDASRAYSLHLANLSAGGMNLRIASRRIDAARASAFAGRRFLARLILADDEEALALLLLAEVRRAQAAQGGVELALEFIARGRFVRASRSLHLFPLRGRGVDRLAALVNRAHAEAQAARAVPAGAAAWYETLA